MTISPLSRPIPNDQVVGLTQRLVQVDSGPHNLVPGENQTDDILESYAHDAGLQVERFETANHKPMLIVTLPGRDPSKGSVGFVHHSDVVGTEGVWKLGEPFSGKLTQDEHGRQIMVGRGSLDTKGPAAQILVAMNQLKSEGVQLDRSMKLFVFPDEETGGKEGAYLLSRTQPERFRDVQYWVVEGSGILAKETLADLGTKQDAPYLAVAQKYTLPTQIVLKNPTSPDQAVHQTLDALKRLDGYLDGGKWTHLGKKSESSESYRRMGNLVGGLKGWALRHLWNIRLVQRQMGTALASANRTDACKTDFYLTSNSAGNGTNPNMKPSSASAVLKLDLTGADRDQALQVIRQAAGDQMKVEEAGDNLRLYLPQENYHGGNHASEPDRQKDAVDLTDRALEQVDKAIKKHGWGDKLRVVDYFTSKSQLLDDTSPVSSVVTLDLRVAIDDDRQKVLDDIARTLGPEFVFHPLSGHEEMEANVRRLSYHSPLMGAAEASLKKVYGPDSPALFGNTTSSNDTRYLMDANPKSEALAFVPILYTEHGAHAPDECVTLESLQKGTDWVREFMQNVDKT